MDQIKNEYDNCIKNEYDLCFRVPTVEELKKARRINRERTVTEKQLLEDAKSDIKKLIDNVEKGAIEKELLPELNKLMDVLKRE